jgi:hypothetical protein
MSARKTFQELGRGYASRWVQAITSAPGNNTVALTDDAGYRAIQALHGVGPLNTTGRHG